MADEPIGDETRTLTVASGPVLLVRAAVLTVLKGPDAGRVERITTPNFGVGGGAGMDLILTDASVSREHLRLALTPQGVRVRDRSKNGTRVGGLRVYDVLVQSDSVLTLGNTTIALQLEADPLALPLSEGSAFGDAYGGSPAMRHLFAILGQAATADISILLEGESGVGKDVLARAIHRASRRAEAPFVVVDCGAIPANLVESELFGHVRGAFTGANEDRRGLFAEAHGGTIFLDEVGELPVEVQPKLLRVLEAKEVRPVGGTKTKRIDVRVVSATNKRLKEAVKRGSFREDLYYRLGVACVTVPPLRDRPEDVIPLATRFYRQLSGDPSAAISPELEAMLTEYSWPGNVRELRNVIERYAALGDAGVSLVLQPVTSPEDDLSALPYHEARRRVLERFEREYVPRVLERAGGVVARAAELAELARPSFYRLLERLRIATSRGTDDPGP